MNTLEITETGERTLQLTWEDAPSIHRLLDVISSILAEEYILMAKQNPDVFLKQGDVK